MADETVTERPTETPPPETPATKRVALSGQSIELPADQADLIERELSRREGRHGSELQRVRQELSALRGQIEAPAEESPAPTGPTMPSEELLLSNPREWQNQYDRVQEFKRQRDLDALRSEWDQRQQEQAQVQAKRQSWEQQVKAFYEKHDDLKGVEDVVDAQYRKFFAKYSEMDADDALDKIAEHARERLAQLGERGKTIKRQPQLETSRARTPSPAVTAEAPGTLTQKIKEMQARMRGSRKVA